MSNVDRLEYRARIAEGQTVYTPDIYSGSLGITKGTVQQAGETRMYPFVAHWPSLTQEPRGVWDVVSYSPRELFTEDEMLELVRVRGFESIDDFLSDPVRSQELVEALNGVIARRLTTDIVRRPGDPEGSF